jgi:hypothetical protein
MGSGSEKPRESRSPVHDVVDFPVRSAWGAKRPPRPFPRQASLVVLRHAPRRSASERAEPVSHNCGRLLFPHLRGSFGSRVLKPRGDGSEGPAIGGIEADLQHAVFAANCFERALPRHFELAFEPRRESVHYSLTIGRGVDESGRKPAPKRHSLDAIAPLQHQRQQDYFCIALVGRSSLEQIVAAAGLDGYFHGGMMRLSYAARAEGEPPPLPRPSQNSTTGPAI